MAQPLQEKGREEGTFPASIFLMALPQSAVAEGIVLTLLRATITVPGPAAEFLAHPPSPPRFGSCCS